MKENEREKWKKVIDGFCKCDESGAYNKLRNTIYFTIVRYYFTFLNLNMNCLLL